MSPPNALKNAKLTEVNEENEDSVSNPKLQSSFSPLPSVKHFSD